MKQDQSLVVWIAIFIIGFGIGVIANQSEISIPHIPVWIFTAFATLIAAFGGSYFAFRLQREQNERKRQSEKLLSVNRVLFELGQARIRLLRFKKQNLDPFAVSQHRALQVQPVPPFDQERAKVNLLSINFLLETKHVEILSQIEVAFETFSQNIYVINERSRLHYEEIQPLVSKAGVGHGAATSPAFLQKAMGPFLFQNLVILTDLVYESVDESLSLLEVQFVGLKSAAAEVLETQALIDLK